MNCEEYKDDNFKKSFEEMDKSLSKRVGIGFTILLMAFVLLLTTGLIYKYI